MAELPSGHLAVKALTQAGLAHVFTLSGGHLFPLYDGCRHEGMEIIDTRHEQTAAFAAEGLGKLTRRPQVAALTAGPGVTNGMSAVAGAKANGSPLLVIGGRAPQVTWGSGSLQELDHVAFMGPVTKHAATATSPESVGRSVLESLRIASTPHRGPAFVDIPMDVIFTPAADDTVPAWEEPDAVDLEVSDVAPAAALLRDARAPVILAGTDVWLNGAWEQLRGLAEGTRTPVVMNGMGRGCLPADHDLAFSRARGTAFKGADLVLVIGTPLDFRVGFGNFGEAAVVHVADHPEQLASHVELAGAISGGLGPAMTALADAVGGPSGDLAEQRSAWLAELGEVEERKRAEEAELLESDRDPIHPARVYGELRKVLDRDAVTIGDGGDFVSYAGKYLDTYVPGRWMDPGPYGCLGTGPGYAAAARIAHPDAQVVLLLGDGAAGFSLMDVDTLVRHRLPVVMVVGNNGIWGLEKHPMRQLYDGWDAAADLQPGLRYDDIVTALGGAGETVEKPGDLASALKRAFDAGVPYLVNVLTDPDVAYPRSAVLM